MSEKDSEKLPEALDFLRDDTVAAARALLGWRLVRETENGVTSGRIVETEAYTCDDPASHSFGRRTARNAAMYGAPGYAYVYRIHQQACLNVVTRPEGIAEAVLIRALEPEDGIPQMEERRGDVPASLLCAGPGRLCRAMAITMEDNRVPLWRGPLRLEPGEPVSDTDVVTTTRIGIRHAAEAPWRFYQRSARSISKRARADEG